MIAFITPTELCGSRHEQCSQGQEWIALRRLNSQITLPAGTPPKLQGIISSSFSTGYFYSNMQRGVNGGLIQWVVVQPYRHSTERWRDTGIIAKGFAGWITSLPPETGEKNLVRKKKVNTKTKTKQKTKKKPQILVCRGQETEKLPFITKNVLYERTLGGKEEKPYFVESSTTKKIRWQHNDPNSEVVSFNQTGSSTCSPCLAQSAISHMQAFLLPLLI